jgi:hypothetical protein
MQEVVMLGFGLRGLWVGTGIAKGDSPFELS